VETRHGVSAARDDGEIFSLQSKSENAIARAAWSLVSVRFCPAFRVQYSPAARASCDLVAIPARLGITTNESSRRTVLASERSSRSRVLFCFPLPCAWEFPPSLPPSLPLSPALVSSRARVRPASVADSLAGDSQRRIDSFRTAGIGTVR
jgi:hypothetical protein